MLFRYALWLAWGFALAALAANLSCVLAVRAGRRRPPAMRRLAWGLAFVPLVLAALALGYGLWQVNDLMSDPDLDPAVAAFWRARGIRDSILRTAYMVLPGLPPFLLGFVARVGERKLVA